MKAVLIALAFTIGFGTLNAQATNLPDENSTWEEIEDNSKVIFKYPQIGLENWLLALPSICIDGDQLRSKNMVHQCKKWKYHEKRDVHVCVKPITTYVYTAISGTKMRCVEWKGKAGDETCALEKPFSYTINLDRKIPVYKKVPANEKAGEYVRSTKKPPLFKKLYPLTDCE